MNRNTYKIYSLVIGTFLLVSCAVPKTIPSSLVDDVPLQYRNASNQNTDTLDTTIFFKDALLNAYIKRALDYNQEVQIALKTTEQLALYYQQSKQQLMPTLDLNVGANRNWVSKNSLNGSLAQQFTGNKYLDDYTATLALSWEVDIWGKAKNQKAAGFYSLLSQEEEVKALKTRITAQVAQTYYHLVALDQQLKIAETNLSLRAEMFKMMQLQFNAGQIDALALNQAGIQQKNAALLVPVAKQQIAIQEQALSLLMGAYPEEIKRQSNLELIPVLEPFSEGVPASLLSRRPDVRAAEYQVNKFNAQTQLAHIAMYPSLSITPSIGMNSVSFDNWFNLPGSLMKTIAANLSAPLLQKKQLKTNYKVALLEQEKAGLQFQRTLMVAVAEVSDALAKTQRNAERLELLNERSVFIDKTLSTATLLYKSGKTSYLEVLIAQNSSLEHELEQNQTQLEIVQTQIELFRALGGL